MIIEMEKREEVSDISRVGISKRLVEDNEFKKKYIATTNAMYLLNSESITQPEIDEIISKQDLFHFTVADLMQMRRGCEGVAGKSWLKFFSDISDLADLLQSDDFVNDKEKSEDLIMNFVSSFVPFFSFYDRHVHEESEISNLVFLRNSMFQ